jgi:ectoine hydroxylase-related dioxygenase (phytanoyl-CoA dioxygenase family)
MNDKFEKLIDLAIKKCPKREWKCVNLTANERQAILRLVKNECYNRKNYDHRQNGPDPDLIYFTRKVNLVASKIIEIYHKQKIDYFDAFIEKSKFINADVYMLKKTVDCIESDGYSYPKTNIKLNSESLEEIKKIVCKYKFRNKYVPQKEVIEISGSQILGSENYPNLNDNYWIDSLDKFVSEEVIKNLIFDPFVLAVASNYLKTTPIHINTAVWASYPNSNETIMLSKNAQMYHQDKDAINFLKVFVYLTDVDEEAGPHKFIKGSHKKELVHHGKIFHERVDDAFAINIYGGDSIVKVLGEAGSVIFGDTSCVHKGQAPKTKRRLILQLEYASSLHLNSFAPSSSRINKFRNYINYDQEVFKRITLNYSNAASIKYNFIEKYMSYIILKKYYISLYKKLPLKLFIKKIIKKLF